MLVVSDPQAFGSFPIKDYVDEPYSDEEGLREPISEPDMESDREFSTEPVDEEDWQHEPSHNPTFDSEEDHDAKAKRIKIKVINKRKHGEPIMNPEMKSPAHEEDWCQEPSHCPTFDCYEAHDTKAKPRKIRVIHKSRYGEPVMDTDMESDREFSPDPVNEENCCKEPSHYPTFHFEEDHDTKAKPRKIRVINQSRYGEPIMDTDLESDREFYTKPVEEEDWRLEPSHSAAFDSREDYDTKAMPRKIRFIKKSGHESSDDAEQPRKRKSKDGANGEAIRIKRKSLDDDGGRGKKSKSKSDSANKLRRLAKSKGKFQNSRSNTNDTEMKEMWNAIAVADSEVDRELQRTNEDDAFIDDTGVDPHDRFHAEDEGFIHTAPQAEEGEEDDEINNLFKSKKKKEKGFERSPEATAMLVEQFMAKFEVAAEEDAEFNRQSKPAINKLKMLPVLTKALSKRQLQEEFLDRGILSVLKNWLEPLPDGCLPNINVRTAILKILTDLSVDIERNERRELLKNSGIGKSIMFLSKTDEEILSNRRLAKDLVDKWIRPIFQKSTRYEDMRGFHEEGVPCRRPQLKKPEAKFIGLEFRDDADIDILEISREPKLGEPSYRQHASRPEASPMDYVLRPQSKIDSEEIRARVKGLKQSERHAKINKKLQNLKGPKKKRLQATKINVEGRGLVKYF